MFGPDQSFPPSDSVIPWQVSKCRHLAIFRRQQTMIMAQFPRIPHPAPNMLMSVEMVNQRLDTANQLVSELRKRIKTFARAAESALAQSTYDVEMLALHEQRIAALQDKVDELITLLLPEDQRTDVLRSGRQIKLWESHRKVN
jgi:hypothetical protein